MTTKVGHRWKLSLFTLQQLIMDQAFPSLIFLILMTFTLKSASCLPPTASLQSCREACLKGARLAHYCACLCNDWSSAGLQAGIGWQANRNSDYSEVVTFVVVVVVLALLSPPAFVVSPGEQTECVGWRCSKNLKGQTARQREVGKAWRQGERVSASRAGNFPIRGWRFRLSYKLPENYSLWQR